jgi:hypothetical protein
MKAILATLFNAYSRWRFVEDTDADAPASRKPAAPETSKDEVTRLRAAIARERRNLESYHRFQCAALAGPCETSIRAMEGRLRALEMMGRRAV